MNLITVKVLWSSERPERDHLLSEIASLLVRCPDLSTVDLSGKLLPIGGVATLSKLFAEVSKMESPLGIKTLGTSGVMVTPNDMNKLAQHLRCLEFLAITYNPSKDPSTTLCSICSTLQQHEIYLKGISMDIAPDPLLLSYLTSYSSLTHLRIRLEIPPANSSKLADQVYREILPHHRDTLELLELSSVRPGALWSTFPTDEQLSGLKQCHLLKELEVTHGTKAEQLQWNETTIFVCLSLLDLSPLQSLLMFCCTL